MLFLLNLTRLVKIINNKFPLWWQEKHHTSQAVIPPNLAELLASSIGKIVKTELDVVVPATLSTVFDPAKLNVVVL